MKRLMYLICEFEVKYKGMGMCSDEINDRNREKISPSTLRRYLSGLQRVERYWSNQFRSV